MTNNDNSPKERADALVKQMTLVEKAGLCSGENFWDLKSVTRLGLPTVTVSDGPHGLRKQQEDNDHLGIGSSAPATCFPTAVATASSWDLDLLNRIGQALGRESAAHNVAVLLGPGINIKRHPLGGRNFEYFSEDPLLAGRLAAALIDGVQSQGVGSCLKHFAAYNQEANRMVVDVVADERTLREIYLRGFEIAIEESNPWAVMTAYNRVNGSYCSDSEWLLDRVLRKEWRYKGMVVSDWMATNDRVRGVRAGMDLEMPGNAGQNDRKIIEAVESGELSIDALDRVAARVVELILKAGQRRPACETPDRDAHHELAREAAGRSAVLLKNERDTLPLRPGQHVAVIGAFARHPRFQGCGSSRVNPTRVDNAFDTLQQWADESAPRGTKLSYAPGYDPANAVYNQALIEDAVATARGADVAVVFAGLTEVLETETSDRSDLLLPDQHRRLIDAVAATGTPTAVVLNNGAPLAMEWIDRVDSVLEAYLAGQASGSATADLLVGRVNPSGKLAETFPLEQKSALSDTYFPGATRQVQYREGLYVGYRYFNSVDGEVLFPFGHGLSYTRFEYADAAISATSLGEEPVRVTLTVSNRGAVAGEETVQVYVRTNASAVHRPRQQLAGFAKVAIAAGATTAVEITLDRRAFFYYDVATGGWAANPGDYTVEVGASSRAIHARLPFAVPGDSSAAGDDEAGAFFRSLSRDRASVPDEVFSSMLGRDIPAPEPSLPFTENSTFGELELTRVGRVVGGFFRRKMSPIDDVDLDDPQMQAIMADVMSGLPLRSMVLGSNGRFGFKALSVLVSLLNLDVFQALRRLFRK